MSVKSHGSGIVESGGRNENRLTVLAAAALVMTVTVVPGAQAPTSAQSAYSGDACRQEVPSRFTRGRGADSSSARARTAIGRTRTRPMSLITYEDARPYARSIKAKTTARLMPPWHIERNIGIQKFKDDPSLTERGDRDHRVRGSIKGAREGRHGRHAAAPQV